MTVKKVQTQMTAEQKLKEKELKKKVAHYYLSPEVSGAAIIESFYKKYKGEQNSFDDMIAVLKETTQELTQQNSMVYVERLLLSQAVALNNLFTCFARRASHQENLKWYETHMRFALKAQSQARATLETLSAVKNPPVYANTANIATNQQINNGVPPAQTTARPAVNDALTHDKGEAIPTQTKMKQEVQS
jgi:hypothetical protein